MTNGNMGAAPRDQSIAESISVSPPFLQGRAQTLCPLYTLQEIWIGFGRGGHFINIGFSKTEPVTDLENKPVILLD